MNGPWNEDVLTVMCVFQNPMTLYVNIYVNIVGKYFIFVSENSLMANALYCIISDVK